MDDLSPAVPELELARDPAPGADRQLRAHPFGIGEEEHELDVAGVVLDQHLERRARARASRLVMLGHRRLDGDDRVGNGVADLRPRAPVDGRVRQVEQHVDDPRPFGFVEQAVEQFRVLRSDPRQRGGGREQGIEQGRAHGRLIAAGDRARASRRLHPAMTRNPARGKMHHDLADPLVDAADRDVLRREGDDLAADFDLAIIFRHDQHLVADLAAVRIVGIALRRLFPGLPWPRRRARSASTSPRAARVRPPACGSPIPRRAAGGRKSSPVPRRPGPPPRRG